MEVEVVVLGLGEHAGVPSLLEVADSTFLSLKLLVETLNGVRVRFEVELKSEFVYFVLSVDFADLTKMLSHDSVLLIVLEALVGLEP